MLQGLLICGHCGRRLTPRYRGNGGLYPIYECNWRKREGLSKTSCMSLQCGYLDRAIEQRVWEVVNEEHLHLAPPNQLLSEFRGGCGSLHDMGVF